MRKRNNSTKEEILKNNKQWLNIPNGRLRITCTKKEIKVFQDYFLKHLSDEEYQKIDWRVE